MPDFGLSILQQPDYIVSVQGGIYYALNVATQSVTTNTSFSSLMSTLNTAISPGGTICFASGTYLVDTALTISNNVSLIGNGRGNTIFQRTISTGSDTIDYTNTAGSILISGITFDGHYPTNTSNVGAELGFLAQANYYIDRCEFDNFNSHAIDLNNAVAGQTPNVWLSNSIMVGANTGTVSFFGIWNDGGGTWNVAGGNPLLDGRLFVTNSNISGCTGNAIFSGGWTDIQGCYFFNNALAAGGQVALPSSGGLLNVSNCVFDADAGLGSGIEMSGSTSATQGELILIGNRISNQSHWGIISNPSPLRFKNAIIKGNIIKNCSQAPSNTYQAIGIQGIQTNFTIEGNVCFDDQISPTQQYGIALDATASDNFIIKNNICYSNVSGQILDSSTGTSKIITNNKGYNPVGIITNPFPTSGAGNIGNASQAAARPATGTTQTVITTPKQISVTGGTISAGNLKINGVNAGIVAGTFKLGIGETINVTYTGTPVFTVYCE